MTHTTTTSPAARDTAAAREPSVAYGVAAKLERPLYLEIGGRKADAPRNVGFTNPADARTEALDRCEEPERWDGMG